MHSVHLVMPPSHAILLYSLEELILAELILKEGLVLFRQVEHNINDFRRLQRQFTTEVIRVISTLWLVDDVREEKVEACHEALLPLFELQSNIMTIAKVIERVPKDPEGVYHRCYVDLLLRVVSPVSISLPLRGIYAFKHLYGNVEGLLHF